MVGRRRREKLLEVAERRAKFAPRVAHVRLVDDVHKRRRARSPSKLGAGPLGHKLGLPQVGVRRLVLVLGRVEEVQVALVGKRALDRRFGRPGRENGADGARPAKSVEGRALVELEPDSAGL